MYSLNDIKEIWNNHGFEILLALCISFILILALYRKFNGKNGTWSTSYYYNENKNYSTNDTPLVKTDSKGEVECRRVLKYIFGKPFNKERPNFLRNPVTGGSFNLELDCYDDELRLACEYNGKQHYHFLPYFHKNKEAFMNQKYRDDMKRRMCKDAGVNLIEVPYNIPLQNIKSYIENQLLALGYKI
jgi:hypothetical protein